MGGAGSDGLLNRLPEVLDLFIDRSFKSLEVVQYVEHIDTSLWSPLGFEFDMSINYHLSSVIPFQSAQKHYIACSRVLFDDGQTYVWACFDDMLGTVLAEHATASLEAVSTSGRPSSP